MQLKHWSEVETTIGLAKMCLTDVEGFDKVSAQLDEVLAAAAAGKEGGRSAPLQFKREEASRSSGSSAQDAASTARKAEQFKERGNNHYKQVRLSSDFLIAPSLTPPCTGHY